MNLESKSGVVKSQKKSGIPFENKMIMVNKEYTDTDTEIGGFISKM